MPTNTAVSENGSSYQIRDNPLYGAAGTTAPQLYAISESSMAEHSSSYSVSNPVCENYYEIRDQSLPSGAYEWCQIPQKQGFCSHYFYSRIHQESPAF
jgi:hypothetical protein